MTKYKTIETMGVSSSIGSPIDGSEDAPGYIKKSSDLHFEKNIRIHLNWHEEIHAENHRNSLEELQIISRQISNFTEQQTSENRPFLVIGGDHSSAIGTWAGVKKALKDSSFALLWIDAHMDSHTMESSQSKNLHGMPLSVITGNAVGSLLKTYPSEYFINGNDVYLFGIRSYENEEENILNKTGAHIYKISSMRTPDEIKATFNSIIKTLTDRYDNFGISLDMDIFDPEDAPGVNTPAVYGLRAELLIELFKNMDVKDKLLGFEISEFNPHKDNQQKTERILLKCIDAVFSEK